MADLFMIAGQALSVGGLLYGWYLSLLFCEHAGAAPTACGDRILLHHIAMA